MKRRICFIDAFDSFSNNVVGLLEKVTNADVTTITIHDSTANKNLAKFLQQYDAVVIGPGPGHPAKWPDTGLIGQIWSLGDADVLPVLGICLGFQSLALAHGASIKQLNQARHGIVTDVLHHGQDIFENVKDLHATNYHSLHVDLGHEILNEAGNYQHLYNPTSLCPSLIPLAWDFDDINGPVLTALRHAERPFWGLQFHPESICTSVEAQKLIKSWWLRACAWNKSQQRVTKLPKLQQLDKSASLHSSAIGNSHDPTDLVKSITSLIGNHTGRINWRTCNAQSLTPTGLCEALNLQDADVVMLDSQAHKTGRYSIIGLIIPEETVKITYEVSERILQYGVSPTQQFGVQLDSIEEVWPILQQILELYNPRSRECGRFDASRAIADNRPQPLPTECPFWGGFLGYISYEAGLQTINVEPQPKQHDGAPDINLAFVQRSLVFDHVKSQIYVQSLLPNDEKWLTQINTTIDGLVGNKKIARSSTTSDEASLDKHLSRARITRPDEFEYRSKVLKCQNSLASGNSYELCLTDRTTIVVPPSDNKPLNPWQLYKRLRARNAAPMGSFIRIGGTTICSSSPERFLSWSRAGHVQFRPIKGTVKKSPDMTSENAHKILNSSKERAENLMIVDLIRHDLSGVIGAENVNVEKLMVVEEYETVWQLVSVIEGELAHVKGAKNKVKGDKSPRPSGIDVLKASLPPGSMTGAPKKRSCEILGRIEQKPRGVYSGVIGYLDVGGAGDWAVVIRTAISHLGGDGPESKNSSAYSSDSEEMPRYENGRKTSEIAPGSSVWHVGAGGAVTIQSTDEGEFLEMETKANSVLPAFRPQSRS